MASNRRSVPLPRDSVLDAEVVSFVGFWYGDDMAKKVRELLSEGGRFAEYLRRSFHREMKENGVR